MGRLVINSKSEISLNSVIDISEFKEQYLTGVLLTSRTGDLTDNAINNFIEQSVSYVERLLGIKIAKQVVLESRDLFMDDWRNWSYMNTNFPVKCAIALKGYIGSIHVVDYPRPWISVKEVSSDTIPPRHMRIVPNREGVTYYNTLLYTNSWSATYSAFSSNGRQVPNYWKVCYITGWEPHLIPKELISVIGKLAAIQVLAVVSENQFKIPGVSGSSLSIDGLSQNISTAISGQTSTYTGRIRTYMDLLIQELRNVEDLYRGILMEIL